MLAIHRWMAETSLADAESKGNQKARESKSIDLQKRNVRESGIKGKSECKGNRIY